MAKLTESDTQSAKMPSVANVQSLLMTIAFLQNVEVMNLQTESFDGYDEERKSDENFDGKGVNKVKEMALLLPLLMTELVTAMVLLLIDDDDDGCVMEQTDYSHHHQWVMMVLVTE